MKVFAKTLDGNSACLGVVSEVKCTVKLNSDPPIDALELYFESVDENGSDFVRSNFFPGQSLEILIVKNDGLIVFRVPRAIPLQGILSLNRPFTFTSDLNFEMSFDR